MSHPTWVRGLKHGITQILLIAENVAPYVGAWIETSKKKKNLSLRLSHPTWVRGLKLIVFIVVSPIIKSHPTWVRGLKL